MKNTSPSCSCGPRRYHLSPRPGTKKRGSSGVGVDHSAVSKVFGAHAAGFACLTWPDYAWQPRNSWRGIADAWTSSVADVRLSKPRFVEIQGDRRLIGTFLRTVLAPFWRKHEVAVTQLNSEAKPHCVSRLQSLRSREPWYLTMRKLYRQPALLAEGQASQHVE